MVYRERWVTLEGLCRMHLPVWKTPFLTSLFPKPWVCTQTRTFMSQLSDSLALILWAPLPYLCICKLIKVPHNWVELAKVINYIPFVSTKKMNQENIVWRAELYSLYVQITCSRLKNIIDCFSVRFLEKKQKSEVLFQKLCKDQCIRFTLPWTLLLLSCQYTSAIYPLLEKKTQCKSSSYFSLNRKEQWGDGLECELRKRLVVHLDHNLQFTTLLQIVSHWFPSCASSW